MHARILRWAATIGLAFGTSAWAQSPVVYTAEIDGIIHPIAAQYLRDQGAARVAERHRDVA